MTFKYLSIFFSDKICRQFLEQHGSQAECFFCVVFLFFSFFVFVCSRNRGRFFFFFIFFVFFIFSFFPKCEVWKGEDELLLLFLFNFL
ncbi:hypothetical protein TCDM_13361 [Trypanosoma cruzi Dm28c]|uniref:Uncharacterized protein n=1 Tax=Trypanosoma cruzi Dm28c TaxID=1416333 RepID=V5CIK0_TRYCR|nr:hypothetical protein TCDM_13361 [Trypanosoma cruzi Dm28c]